MARLPAQTRYPAMARDAHVNAAARWIVAAGTSVISFRAASTSSMGTCGATRSWRDAVERLRAGALACARGGAAEPGSVGLPDGKRSGNGDCAEAGSFRVRA